MCVAVAMTFGVMAAQQYLDDTWMKCQWTDDDSTFDSLRKDISALAKDKLRLDSYIASQAKKLEKPTVTRQDVFRSATALFEATDKFDDWYRIRESGSARKVYDLFPRVSKPTSYEFTRIRWLFTARFEVPHHNLVKVGEKMLEREPNDTAILRMMLRVYAPQAFPEDRPKAAKLVERLERLAPGKVSTYAASGYFFYFCWMKSKSSADAQQAATRLRQALGLSNSQMQKQLISETLKEMGA